MHYITVAEFESPGTVTCKVQGLTAKGALDLAIFVQIRDFKFSNDPNVFEIDTRGIDVLNILNQPDFDYRIISQSTVIEVSNIGGRTDKVQKTIWTLGKQ